MPGVDAFLDVLVNVSLHSEAQDPPDLVYFGTNISIGGCLPLGVGTDEPCLLTMKPAFEKLIRPIGVL